MKKIILVRGLPGSGKSHLLEEYKGAGIATYDDFSMHVRNHSLAPVLREISVHEVIAIADVQFCLQGVIDKAIETFTTNMPDRMLSVVSFENNDIQCKANVRARMKAGDTRDVMACIDFMSRFYVPTGKIIPVWS